MFHLTRLEKSWVEAGVNLGCIISKKLMTSQVNSVLYPSSNSTSNRTGPRVWDVAYKVYH